MLTRYATGILIATGVTFALLFLMQFLIKSGKDAITGDESRTFVDFVRLEREESLQRRKPKPKRPPIPETPPPDVPKPQQEDLNPAQDTIFVSNVGVDAGNIDIASSFGLAAADGEYLPIVKVAPMYPRRAQSRGLEGYCTVEYTVTKTGAVQNPRVIDCTSSLFERSSIEAALKFKYKPRVVNGEPIDVAGVKNRFTYILED